MSTKITKKLSILIATFVAGILVCTALTGCSGLNITESDINQATNVVYLGQVNTVSKDIKKAYSDFSTYVKDKDFESMKAAQTNAQSIIDTFNSLEVPDQLKDVHNNYKDAFVQLQAAVKDYVQVYSDTVNGSQDAEVLNQRVATVQNEYNQGIELLNKADKAAAAITN